jgi:hypothetical protein
MYEFNAQQTEAIKSWVMDDLICQENQIVAERAIGLTITRIKSKLNHNRRTTQEYGETLALEGRKAIQKKHLKLGHLL